jgi:site-specific recombinase XerC
MISLLQQKNEYVFKPNPHSIRQNYYKQRKKLTVELQNPRIRAIKLHTFRHWKATKEYHKTKDILHVMRLLGYKNTKNTIIYTQLVNFKNNEYHVSHAKSLEEKNKLIEAGFEYVRYSHKGEVAIYKKPK